MTIYTPEYAIIEVTTACNLRCKHCGSSAGEKRQNELSLQEIKQICEHLKELGCQGISLMGGEVFLRDDWANIAEYIIQTDMSCAIITNGLMINNEIIHILENLNIVQLGISLDGALPETHNSIRCSKKSYKKALEAIYLSLKSSIPVTTVITTISKYNIDELNSLFNLLLYFNKYIDWQIKLASSHDVKRFPVNKVVEEKDYLHVAQFISATKQEIISKGLNISISEAHDLGYHSEKYEDISPLWQGCQAGIKTLGIQSNGNIKGCLALPDDFIEGNIREISIIDLWNHPDAFSYTRQFKSENLTGICQNCSKKQFCRGGCADFSYSLTGNIYKPAYCLYQIESQGLPT
jgi:radical SAM protein with 4Fe4S-binding SPASM domain